MFDPASFAISTAVSFGASALLSLFGRPKKPITQREVNKLDTFNAPNSSYGESIPDIYGKVRVRGNYVAAQSPPDWERDDYFDPVAREWTLTYIYYGSLGVLWASNPPLDNGQEVKKIWFNRELYYSNGAVDGLLGTYWGRFTGLSVYNYYGEQTSTDATLNFMGSNHIAYHQRTYSAMARLRLNNSDGNLFDSRYPDLEAAIDTHASGATLYLSDVIGKILEKAGYTSAEYDVTELNQTPLRGFKAYPGSVSDKLAQLQWAYAFEVVDTGSKLKFIKSERPSSSATLTPDNFAAREEGGSRPDLFVEEIDQAIADLPTQVRVTFSDYENDYLPGEVLSFEVKLEENKNIEEIDLSNLTLTQSEAQAIANRVLMLAWARRRTYKFSLLPKYCFLEAGDVITCEFRTGETETVQIKRLNHKASGIIDIEAYAYESSALSGSVTYDPNPTPSTPPPPLVLPDDPYAPLPRIISFSPPQGDIGDAITIYGAGFTSATSAAINGTNITSFTVIDDEKISGVVDIGTTTGSITVVNAAGTGVSLSDFVVVNIGFGGGENGGIGSLRYTKIIGDLTIPPVGGTVNVTVEKPDIFGPKVPVMITYEVSTPGIGIAQLFVTQVNGNVITLERWQEGIVQTEYFPASPLLIMSAIVERYSGVFGGVLNADWLSTGGYNQILNLPETFPPSEHTHPHNHTVSVYISIPEGGGSGGGTYTTSIDATVNDNNNSGDPGGISIDLTGFMQYDTYDPGRNGVVDLAENINGINAAGNSKYYGTNETGTAGFYDLPTSAVWGNITGTIANQIDLQSALDSKFDTPTGTTEQYLTGDGSLATFPSLTVEKTHTTHSLLSNGLVTITLQSEYFHFVDPINYDGTVYLPAVTANDYFECEIINSGDGSRRVIIVENDDTHIITLGGGYLGTRYRSVYIYWDGTIWRVWIRGSY